MAQGTTALLVNCPDVADLLTEMKVTYDEAYMEEAAVKSIKRSVGLQQ